MKRYDKNVADDEQKKSKYSKNKRIQEKTRTMMTQRPSQSNKISTKSRKSIQWKIETKRIRKKERKKKL